MNYKHASAGQNNFFLQALIIHSEGQYIRGSYGKNIFFLSAFRKWSDDFCFLIPCVRPQVFDRLFESVKQGCQTTYWCVVWPVKHIQVIGVWHFKHIRICVWPFKHTYSYRNLTFHIQKNMRLTASNTHSCGVWLHHTQIHVMFDFLHKHISVYCVPISITLFGDVYSENVFRSSYQYNNVIGECLHWLAHWRVRQQIFGMVRMFPHQYPKGIEFIQLTLILLCFTGVP